MSRLPVEITAARFGVVRPIDLRHRYANPAKELGRLAAGGALQRLVHGYYVVVPEPYRGTAWRPSVEAAGLAIAQLDYGRDGAAGMGMTAARLLGALARALGTAFIAVPKQRPEIDTSAGRVRFVTRDISTLDLRRADTDLSSGWITSPEQTVLDLADRPDMATLPETEVAEAIRGIASDIDWQLVAELARRQRKRPASVRAALVAGVDPPVRMRGAPHSRGLPLAHTPVRTERDGR